MFHNSVINCLLISYKRLKNVQILIPEKGQRMENMLIKCLSLIQFSFITRQEAHVLF